MPIVEQLDLYLDSRTTITVQLRPGGMAMVTLGERDDETIRWWGTQAAFQRLAADIDNALTGQGDES